MSQYRILKLKSGETVIGKLTNSSKNSITIDRPMEVHFPQFVDAMGNTQKGKPCMKNWLAGTETKSVTLPNDYVAVFLPPTREMIFLYEQEKKIEDSPSVPRQEESPLLGDTQSMLENLFGIGKPEDSKDNSEPKMDPNSVSVRIKIPPAIWMSMLAHGLLGGEMEEEIPPDDVDFEGGGFEDWSDDPSDY